MKLKDLLINFEYTVQGNLDTEISDIIYDSRKVEKGTVFVCLKGYTSDGHRYAKSAVEKGASALVISDSLDFEVPSDVAVVKVDDTRYALSLMSIEFSDIPRMSSTRLQSQAQRAKPQQQQWLRKFLSTQESRPAQSEHSVLFTAEKPTKPTTQLPNHTLFRNQCVI